MTAKGPALKIGADHDFIQRVNHLVLKCKCSLYAARTLLIEQGVNVKVSIRTLYNYVHHHGFPLLPNQLIQGARKPRKQGIRKRLAHNNLKGRSIEERPAHINNRSEIGHHEMDTVVGPPGSGKVLLVLTERVTRFEHIILMPNKTAKSVCRALDRLERFYGSRLKTSSSPLPVIMAASSLTLKVSLSPVAETEIGRCSSMPILTVLQSAVVMKMQTGLFVDSSPRVPTYLP